MGETPDQLRAEIAGTRADMTATVDAITDRTSPRQVAKRQVGRVSGRFQTARQAVMGSVSDLTDSAASRGSAAGDTLSSAAGSLSSATASLSTAPGAAADKAKGNPIAAGVIAFGAGLVLASVIPSSKQERQAANTLAEQAQPAVDSVASAAQAVGDEMRQHASEAADQVKDTAADAAGQVKDHATSAGQDLGEAARSAASDVAGTAQQQYR